MESGFLLNIVIRKSAAIFKLFSGENQTLLIRWNPLFVLNLSLDIRYGIRRLNIECDCLSSQGFHKDLHTSSQSKHQVKGWLLLDVVIRKSSPVFELFSRKNKALLIWWNSLFVLNFCFYIRDRVGGLYIQCNGLTSQSLHKDLHTSSQSKNQVKGGLLLNIVIRKGSTVFQLFPCKDQSLLIRWDTFLILDLGLHIRNSIRWLNVQCDRLSSQRLHKNLHTSSQSKHQMKSRFFLDVVISKGSTILQLLTRENKPLLVRWNTFLILDLSFHIGDRIRWFHVQRNRLPCKSFHKDLHSSSETKHQMKGGLLLNVIICKGSAILKLLSCKNQSLLVRGNSLFILDLSFHVGNSIWRLNVQSNRLPCKSLYKDLHTTSQAKDEMKSRLLLDVVICKRSTILQLLPSEDETLLIRRNTFLVLDLSLNIGNGIRWFNIKGDRFAGQCLHKDLHSTSQSEYQVKGWLLLNVVIGKSSSIFQLFSCENKSLLVRGNPFLVLNLRFHVRNRIGWLNIECYRFPCQRFDKDLHTSSQTEHQVQCGLLLDVIIRKSSTILKLLSGEDQTLLIWRNSFFVLNFSLHIGDSIRRLNIERDGFSSQSFYKDLHTSSQSKHQMKGRLLLNVVIRKCPTIFELLTCKNEALLIRWDPFLVLDFCLDIGNSIWRLNIQCNGFPSQSLHKDLHTSSQSENQVQGWFLLNVIVRKGSAILQLLYRKDKPLLVWWNSLFVLDLCFHIRDCIGRLNVQRNRLPCKSLDKDLHAPSQTKHKVKSRLFLDIVICKGSAIFKLLSCEDQSLLVWGNTLFVLNLCFNIGDGIRRLHIQGDGFPGESLDKDLHPSSKSKHQV